MLLVRHATGSSEAYDTSCGVGDRIGQGTPSRMQGARTLRASRMKQRASHPTLGLPCARLRSRGAIACWRHANGSSDAFDISCGVGDRIGQGTPRCMQGARTLRASRMKQRASHSTLGLGCATLRSRGAIACWRLATASSAPPEASREVIATACAATAPDWGRKPGMLHVGPRVVHAGQNFVYVVPGMKWRDRSGEGRDRPAVEAS